MFNSSKLIYGTYNINNIIPFNWKNIILFFFKNTTFLFLVRRFIPYSVGCELVFLSFSNISFVSFSVLVPTKSFTSGLFNNLPTLSCRTCCFCCAFVLVGSFITFDDRCANPRIYFRSLHAPHPSKNAQIEYIYKNRIKNIIYFKILQ